MKITRFLETSITLFSILVFGVLLYTNLNFDSYIFAGTNPLVSNSDVYLIIPALIAFLVILFLSIHFYASKRQAIILIIVINILAFLGRAFIIQSFEIVPTADMYRVVLAGTQIFSYKDYTSLFTGGYVNLFSNQFGVISLLGLFFKQFEFYFNPYYFLNIVLIQGSIILITATFFAKQQWKSAMIATLLLNAFIPNLFSMFIIYGDLFSLFALSAFILIQNLTFKKQYIRHVLLFIFILMAMMARPTSIIWFIAFMITALLTKKWRKLFEISIGLVIALIIVQSLPSLYSGLLNIEISDTSLPHSQFIGIAFEKASIDKESPGFYTDKYFNYHIQNKYDSNRTHAFILEDVSKNIENLIHEGKFFDFQNKKVQILWTDPDFETMNFILPMNYTLTKEDFRENNDLRIGVASEGSEPTNALGAFIIDQMFQIRKLEKVFYLMLLLCAFVSSILNLRYKNMELIWFQLLGIGFFLFFQFMEIKPRYLLVYMNFLVLHFVYGVAIISEQISSKLKKNP